MNSQTLIKTKDKVYDKFVQCVKESTNCFNLPFVEFRCDNGTEYCNNKMSKFLSDLGISQGKTVRYTLQMKK